MNFFLQKNELFFRGKISFLIAHIFSYNVVTTYPFFYFIHDVKNDINYAENFTSLH